MTCRCTTNTLRLFIRSVAQVDVTASARSRREICSSTIGTFGRPRAFQNQHTFQSRYKSTSSSSSDQSGGQSRKGHKSVGVLAGDGSADTENAIAEISMEAIDAIAAEATSDTGFEVPISESTPKSRAQEPDTYAKAPRRKDDSVLNQTPSNVTFRGTGFTPNLGSEEQTSNVSSTRIGFTPESTPDPGMHPTSKRGFQGPESVGKDASKFPAEDGWVPPQKEPWQVQKAAMKEKFPDGWNPMKRLSPDAMAGIRALHQQMPEKYTSWVLADHFKVSPEAIRRILKSKWSPDADTQMDREMRWFRRGERVWSRYAELGVKPPRKWRDEGIGKGKPEWLKKRQQQQEPRVIPALITTARREGGYFGEDREATRNSERPQLITTARPPEGH